MEAARTPISDEDIKAALWVAEARSKVIQDDIALALAARHEGRLSGKDLSAWKTAWSRIPPEAWAEWVSLRDTVVWAIEQSPERGRERYELAFLRDWVLAQMTCDQCEDALVPGVLTGSNTPHDVQRCDLCSRYATDLDAAHVLAVALSVTRGANPDVKFWQHDDELLARSEKWPALSRAEIGFEVRTYLPATSRDDDCVLAGTNPWVEIDKEPVNWWHARVVLTAARLMDASA